MWFAVFPKDKPGLHTQKVLIQKRKDGSGGSELTGPPQRGGSRHESDAFSPGIPVENLAVRYPPDNRPVLAACRTWV
jgi:hypothetical protein